MVGTSASMAGVVKEREGVEVAAPDMACEEGGEAAVDVAEWRRGDRIPVGDAMAIFSQKGWTHGESSVHRAEPLLEAAELRSIPEHYMISDEYELRCPPRRFRAHDDAPEGWYVVYESALNFSMSITLKKLYGCFWITTTYPRVNCR